MALYCDPGLLAWTLYLAPRQGARETLRGIATSLPTDSCVVIVVSAPVILGVHREADVDRAASRARRKDTDAGCSVHIVFCMRLQAGFAIRWSVSYKPWVSTLLQQFVACFMAQREPGCYLHPSLQRTRRAQN